MLEEVLPPVKPVGQKPRDRRPVINGIRWRVRTGAPWRDIPERYGPWETVYCVFRTWQRDGVWAQILTKLQIRADAKGLITWDVSVDSPVARASGRRGCASKGDEQVEPPSTDHDTEPHDDGLGRSRGGLSTKLHLAVEAGQRPCR